MNQINVIVSRLSDSFMLNCKLFILTLLFSLPLGLLITFGSTSRFRPLRWLVKTFVWIIRGTPLMLQLMIIFYGPGLLKMSFTWPGGESGRFVSAIVAFVINYACYFSEIYRGGIESIPKGQYEVIKRILPPIGNEVITLVKDTSLARIIANKEIIMMAGEYSSKGLIWPLFATGVYFLIFVGVLTILLDWLEKKLNYFCE